ncbi:hypothetical protein [Paracidovorax valerianellae]|uniref:Uncharacterized protein n=1 Tax=Paracidovorax valerianellae TaxID=187868 RepID=A0A1G7EX82_9BURK|nr:hypothetical protein [Paracidovorax valerianellae]MDA8447171.1 hypothetical protein [Paracidovorax valerianellae]SDE68248.1 hypothetical protein SAMN05192589_12517 [Paracidovorax valerianellae]
MTSPAPPDWHAADKAYQLHHLNCRQCIAAGINPTRHERCDEGAALWTTYNEAGNPPQFAWLSRGKHRNDQIKPTSRR